MALTAKVTRTYKGQQDVIDILLTDSDIYYAGGIMAAVSGKAAVAATAEIQQILGILTGEYDDGDRVDAKVIGSSNTIKAVLKRGKVWLPHTSPAQTDIGKIFVNSSDDAMVDAPATANTTYYGYECIGYDSSMGLLFDLRNVISVTNET